MKRYEYKSIKIDFKPKMFTSSDKSNEKVLDEVDTEMAKAGKEGWFLNSSMPIGSNGYLVSVILYFSREI